jgi:hypothetical protein
VRLALTDTFPRGSIDGAWWPHSADLGREIGPLVTALTDSYASRVTHIAYDIATWLPARHRMPQHPGYINMGWFVMGDPHQVTLTLEDGTRVVLLVVPPELPTEQAEWALRRAVEPGNRLGAREILQAAGVSALDDGVQRWAGEGGLAGRPTPARRSPIPQGLRHHRPAV